MRAKNSRQRRRSQGRRLLTFEEALDRREVKEAVRGQRKDWRKRQDERLRQFKNNPEAATNLEIVKAAARVELETKDVEPTARPFLLGKLLNKSLRFFELDAVDNLVKGNLADLRDAMRRGKRRRVLIYEDDLQRVCRGTKRGTRGPSPDERDRAPRMTIRLPLELLEQIDELAHSREFVSRSDVIRTFVRDALRKREQRAAA